MFYVANKSGISCVSVDVSHWPPADINSGVPLRRYHVSEIVIVIVTVLEISVVITPWVDIAIILGISIPITAGIGIVVAIRIVVVIVFGVGVTIALGIDVSIVLGIGTAIASWDQRRNNSQDPSRNHHTEMITPRCNHNSTAPQEAAPPVPDVSDTTQAHGVGPDQSSVFVPLLEGTPGSPLPDPLPQVGIGGAPLDEAAIRSSVAPVESALRRASVFQDLQHSYDRLLSSYFGLGRRVVELQHDPDNTARLASSFVQFVQQKFSIQANKLQRSQQKCDELRNALQERLHNAAELADLRDHLAYRERVHADAVVSFEQTIHDLNCQLAVALAAATANALGASGTDPQLQARLDAAIANQADTARDLEDAQESIKALEASQTSLENSNRYFRQSRSSSGGAQHQVWTTITAAISAKPDTNEAAQTWGSGRSRQHKGGGGRSTADASAGGRSSGKDDDNGSAWSGRSGSFLSDQDLRQLAPNNIPRERWIPGYHGPVNFSVANVDPWSVRPVRQLSDCVQAVSRLVLSSTLLFPQRVPVSSPGTWYPELITEANIVALYEIRPWTVLQHVIPPRSCDISGWFTKFVRLYVVFEGESLRAYWEATHKRPISKAMKADDPFMAQVWLDHKQRRSRLGPKWQTLLKHLLAGMIAGHCDLDLLLDPFFPPLSRTSEYGLWYPSLGASRAPANLVQALSIVDAADPWRNQYRTNPCTSEHIFWYPGLGASRAPVDLVHALSIVDAADPWRNQYRTNPNDHPGYHIVRLDSKFRTPSNDQVI
ncbi:unnamed protein product [Phytophthora fragariaefolia]|uniref:Unnamed protein product n=1 Tax=Phytophthora fragariaefolia TaxID=1490495 RepID=A0A9W7CY63_9STRA|nr:unnamed protein product [Phytophthora fragariaefolia]